MITSLLRRNDVATSFRRNSDVIIAPCVHRAFIFRLFAMSNFLLSLGMREELQNELNNHLCIVSDWLEANKLSYIVEEKKAKQPYGIDQ